ncbi:hypothetical protein C1646_774835 [Rhizophagus diaphanus]|nr:hypothetical protein C1646_774835 [Rhizophagus diaphanus] [Rhizophagus sp. MUCL 43196]
MEEMISHLESERTKALIGKKRINTLPGNSNWFLWEWPNEGEYAGYICARSISNIGKWNYFSPEKLEKLQKKEIQKPDPQVSQHIVPETPWIIPLPNKLGIELLSLILLYGTILS